MSLMSEWAALAICLSTVGDGRNPRRRCATGDLALRFGEFARLILNNTVFHALPNRKTEHRGEDNVGT